MAIRTQREKRAKTFTTIKIAIPTKISVCGDKKFEEEWKERFKEDYGKSTRFVIKGIKKLLDAEDFGSIFEDQDIKEKIKKIKQDILDEINRVHMDEKKDGLYFSSWQDLIKHVFYTQK